MGLLEGYRPKFFYLFFRLVALHSGHTYFLSRSVGYVLFFPCIMMYEGRLISNAHSEIFRKRDHAFKQTKVESKVQYFS